MSKRWTDEVRMGSVGQRHFEETEIIDIKGEDRLAATRKPLIQTHPYRVSGAFCEFGIADHPRRSCDAMWMQAMEALFIDAIPIPKHGGGDELRALHKVPLDDEDHHHKLRP